MWTRRQCIFYITCGKPHSKHCRMVNGGRGKERKKAKQKRGKSGEVEDRKRVRGFAQKSKENHMPGEKDGVHSCLPLRPTWPCRAMQQSGVRRGREDKQASSRATLRIKYEQTIFKRRHLCSQQTWKKAHHHWSLEKCKSKLHWDTILCQLESQSLKNQEITDAGEDVEK